MRNIPTIFWLAWIFSGLASLTIGAGLIYVLVHFLAKVW